MLDLYKPTEDAAFSRTVAVFGLSFVVTMLRRSHAIFFQYKSNKAAV